MAVSFVRIDDRMIHGQTVTRWAVEYPCDGIIAVNDAAASNPVLKSAYKSAAPDKKTFVWTMDHFKEKAQTVLDSDTRYFLITKNPLDMAEILVNFGFVPGDVKTVIVGPCNDRPGTTKLGNNQSITQEEAQAFEDISKAGYTVDFRHAGGGPGLRGHLQGRLHRRLPPDSRQGHRHLGQVPRAVRLLVRCTAGRVVRGPAARNASAPQGA